MFTPWSRNSCLALQDPWRPSRQLIGKQLVEAPDRIFPGMSPEDEPRTRHILSTGEANGLSTHRPRFARSHEVLELDRQTRRLHLIANPQVHPTAFAGVLRCHDGIPQETTSCHQSFDREITNGDLTRKPNTPGSCKNLGCVCRTVRACPLLLLILQHPDDSLENKLSAFSVHAFVVEHQFRAFPTGNHLRWIRLQAFFALPPVGSAGVAVTRPAVNSDKETSVDWTLAGGADALWGANRRAQCQTPNVRAFR